MLKRTSDGFAPTGVDVQESPQAGAVDAGRLLAVARRQWLLVLVIASVALGLAAAYLLSTKPTYQSRAHVLLDTRRLQVFQQQSLVKESAVDSATVESELEVIRSEAIGGTVVDTLRLADDPEFFAGSANRVASMAARVLRWVDQDLADRLFGPVASSSEERVRAAIFHLSSNLSVQRVRSTFVIEIAFASQDAGKAARVANAVADAYIIDQTQTKQYTTRRATNWLEERMIELRDRSVVAEKAVQDFRTKNNLVRLGGAVLSEQQLSDLNAQAARARDQTAEVAARLKQLQAIMTSRVPDASMSAWLGNDIINKLRVQYSDVSRREAELTLRLGADHEAVGRAKKELTQIERSAAEELRRMAQTWTAELEAAQARERASDARLKENSARNEGSRQEQGALQVLESTSKTYQGLYDTFLQRYVEASTQQNFQSSEARVITSASRGLKIQPNPQQVLLMGGALGLMLGAGAALARERLKRVLRTPNELEQSLGVECLGVVPMVQVAHAPRGSVDLAKGAPGNRVMPQDIGIARQVLAEPFSRFTETVRGIKVAADTSGTEHRTIGVTSAVPGEGKSTIAANLAQLAAHGGSRTLLIDADLRRPSLTRLMSPGAESGLLQVLNGTSTLDDVVWHDEQTGLEFLPTAVETTLLHSSEVIASRAMEALLARVRDSYDYVVVDYPPLAPIADTKAAGHLVDGFVLVVEWGQTSPAAIAEALASADTVRGRVVGAILNKADPTALKTLESYKGRLYARYYGSESVS